MIHTGGINTVFYYNLKVNNNKSLVSIFAGIKKSAPTILQNFTIDGGDRLMMDASQVW